MYAGGIFRRGYIYIKETLGTMWSYKFNVIVDLTL
jgi:hypothetical protein